MVKGMMSTTVALAVFTAYCEHQRAQATVHREHARITAGSVRALHEALAQTQEGLATVCEEAVSSLRDAVTLVEDLTEVNRQLRLDLDQCESQEDFCNKPLRNRPERHGDF